ncbi:hypothetical protein D9M69_718350 [compost metagenome]
MADVESQWVPVHVQRADELCQAVPGLQARAKAVGLNHFMGHVGRAQLGLIDRVDGMEQRQHGRR